MTGGWAAGAVVARELRRTGRVRATYLIRGVFLFVLIGVILLTWMDFGPDANPRLQSAIGRTLYVAFFITQGCLAVLVCPILLCGSIADESADRTLEVLLTTPVGRFGLVLAKFLSRMGTVFLLQFASLPVMIGCLAFGGVSPLEVAISAGAVLGVSAALGALTVLYSTIVKKAHLAALMTYFSFLIWGIGAIFLDLALGRFTGPPGSKAAILSPILYFGYHLSGEMEKFIDPLAAAGFEALWLAALVAGSLLLASRLVGWTLRRHVVRESAARDAQTSPGQRVLGCLGWGLLVGVAIVLTLLAILAFLPGSYWKGFAEAPAAFAVALLAFAACVARALANWRFRGRSYRRVWDDAFLWKEIALQGTAAGRISASTMTALVAGAALLFMFEASAAREEGIVAAILCLALGLALVVASVVGGASVAGEREDGLLDLLLVTPARASRLFDAKVWGTLFHLWPLGLFCLLFGGAQALHGHVKSAGGFALALLVWLAAVYAQSVIACTFSLVLRRSVWAILLALAVPLAVCAAWPIACAIFLQGRFTALNNLVAFHLNPFWYLAELICSPLVQGWHDHVIGLLATSLIHLAMIAGAGYGLRLWSYRTFPRWARAGNAA